MTKTALGLEENLEAALCYFGLWFTGLLFYFIDDKNKTIRFHAMQSILVFLPLMILAVIFGGGFGLFHYEHGWYFLGWIGWFFWVLVVILWLILMIKAYQMQKIKLPIIGDIAEKNS